MIRRVALSVVATWTVMAMTVSAYGEHTPPPGTCSLHVDEANIDNPNQIDPDGDWAGETGSGNYVVPVGDIYREGTDLLKAWVARDADGSFVTIKVADLPDAMFNVIFRVIFRRSNAPETLSWVGIRLKGYGQEVNYGHNETSVTGGTLYVTDGNVDGLADPAADTITIAFPAVWDLQTGTSLDELLVQSEVLIGSPEPLPRPPSPFRHGLIYIADTTVDGTKVCGAYFNAPAEP